MTENKNAKTPTDDGQPVAWLKTWSDGSVSVLKTKSRAFADHELEPLYAAPQKRDLTCVCGAVWDGEMMVHPPKKREWVGLHGSEVPDTYKYDVMFMEGWLWAEERLKDKNHG